MIRGPLVLVTNTGTGGTTRGPKVIGRREAGVVREIGTEGV
jgi:hypothetical protein